MRVYISVDMEGIGGVAALDQVVRGGFGYPRAQELMTAETNAAIEGVFEGGATEVFVNDSHGTMDNLIHELLDPRARYLFGTPKALCMAEGLTPDFDVALFVGYHAPAGGKGVLAHTFSSHFTSVRVNGQVASEASINALLAATRGVPLGLITGDDVICAIAELAFPGITTVPVKIAHGYSTADSLSPSVARERVKFGAREAVRNADKTKLISIPARLLLEIDMPNATAAELAEGMPGAVRIGERTISREVASPDEIIGMISVSYNLANIAVATKQTLVNRR